MQIDKEWIARNFDRFNKEYFGGNLPRPKYSVNNARTRLGSMAFKWRSPSPLAFFSARKREMYDFTIRLSNYYDMTEEQFQNVLLHEMIHYYIAVNRFQDDSVHGTMFRSIAGRLNKQGWHIAVRTDTRGWPVAKRNEGRRRIVLAGITVGGEHFLSVIAPRYVRLVDRQAHGSPLIRSHWWFETADDYFGNFPQSRTLRGRRVAPSFFEEKVRGMQPYSL